MSSDPGSMTSMNEPKADERSEVASSATASPSAPSTNGNGKRGSNSKSAKSTKSAAENGAMSALTRDPRLRSEAGLYYMTDQGVPTLDAMAKDPRFSAVSRKTLERWSKEDRWPEKRAQFFEVWAARARERIGSDLCRIRQRDLADLETVRNIAMDKLTDEELVPKSWEGVAKVLLEAGEQRDRLASAIGMELLPNAGSARPVTAADVGVAPEELQIAAKEILRHRREVLRLASGAASGATPAGPAPAPTPMPTADFNMIVGADEASPLRPREARAAKSISLGIGNEDYGDEDEVEDLT